MRSVLAPPASKNLKEFCGPATSKEALGECCVNEGRFERPLPAPLGLESCQSAYDAIADIASNAILIPGRHHAAQCLRTRNFGQLS